MNNVQNRLACAAAAIALLIGGSAWGQMIVSGYTPQVNDRFYTGSDKDFLGMNYDFSGVGRPLGGTSNTQGWATMISPSMFLCASHNAIANGVTVRFYYTNNPADGYEDHTVIARSSIFGSDVIVEQLDGQVSNRIAKYALVSGTSTGYLMGEKVWLLGRASLDITQTANNPLDQRIGRAVYNGDGLFSDGTGTDQLTWSYYPTGSGYFLGTGVDAESSPGDSGAPSFVTWDNQLVMTGTRWQATADYGVRGINAQIQQFVQARTGGTESVTFVSKPTINPIPILQDNWNADAVNAAPTPAWQTFRQLQSTNSATSNVQVAGPGGTYASPFNNNTNNSLRLYSAASGASNTA